MSISLDLYHKVGIEMFDDIDDLYEHKQKSLNASFVLPANDVDDPH